MPRRAAVARSGRGFITDDLAGTRGVSLLIGGLWETP